MKKLLRKLQDLQFEFYGKEHLEIDAHRDYIIVTHFSDSHESDNDKYYIFRECNTKEEYQRLLRTLNKREFLKINEEITSIQNFRENFCKDCNEDCEKCAVLKGSIVNKYDFEEGV